MSLFTIGVESHDGKSFFHDIEANDMHHALAEGESIAGATTREHARNFFLTSVVAMGIPAQEDNDKDFTYIDQDDQTTIDHYGLLVTWRTAKGCMAIDVPKDLVKTVNAASGVKHGMALSKLEKLLSHQFDCTSQQIIKDALGDKYQGTRVDYLTLTRMACRELGY